MPALRRRRSTRHSAATPEAANQADKALPDAVLTDTVPEPPMEDDDNKFTVKYLNAPAFKKAGKKHRASGTEVTRNVVAKNIFRDEHFNLDSVVYPLKVWKAMKPFKSFMVGTTRFSLSQTVFVNRDPTLTTGIDTESLPPTTFWLAHIHEIRALNAANVFAKVHWFYWPEDLPNGRQWWHGKNELILSNHVQVIDVKTVSGKADVFAWGERPERKSVIEQRVFWRGKYHCLVGKASLKEPNTYCICDRPINPDHMNILCTNPDCETWLHEECIREAALKAAYEEGLGLGRKDKATNGDSGAGKYADTVTLVDSPESVTEHPWKGIFDAQVEYEIDEGPRVLVWDLRQTQAVAAQGGKEISVKARTGEKGGEVQEAVLPTNVIGEGGVVQEVFRGGGKWNQVICLVCGVPIGSSKGAASAVAGSNQEAAVEEVDKEVGDGDVAEASTG